MGSDGDSNAEQDFPICAAENSLTNNRSDGRSVLRCSFMNSSPNARQARRQLRHLSSKKKGRLHRHIQTLLWGIDPRLAGDHLVHWVERIRHEKKAKQLIAWAQWAKEFQNWMDRLARGQVSCCNWLEGLFWIVVLRLTSPGNEDAACALVNGLENWCCSLNDTRSASTPEQWWIRLLGLELQLTWGLLFDSSGQGRRQFCPEVIERLNRSAIESLDGEGSMSPEKLMWVYPALAIWTRCERLSRLFGVRIWRVEAQQAVERILTHAVRWVDNEGRMVLYHDGPGCWHKPLLRKAWKACGKPASLQSVLERVLDRRKYRKPRGGGHGTMASWIAQEAGITLLRANWSTTGPTLACVNRSDWHAELCTRLGRWLSGRIDTVVELENERFSVGGTAELVCEFIDERMRYAEWQICLTDGWILQRQFALAPEDGFLLWADALIGDRSVAWRYEFRWPMAANVRGQPAQDTHEGWLVDSKGRRLLVIPLALQEWRAADRRGNLILGPQQLVLNIQGVGRAFWVPLVFDVADRGSEIPFTWRQLTVGEDMKRVPPDVAVGYRVQLGEDQWVIYRSLQGAKPRTLIGQHWSAEFVIGRLRRRGDCRILVEVETADE